MPCTLGTRDQVSIVVLGAVRHKRGLPDITEASRWLQDLQVDEYARRTYYLPTMVALEQCGCEVGGVTRDDFQGAETVGDVVSAIWGAMG